LSALVLVTIALVCVWAGGYLFMVLAIAGGALLATEWLEMCGYAAPYQRAFWVPGVIVAAVICGARDAPWVGLLFLLAGAVAAGIVAPHRGEVPGHDAGRARVDLAFGIPYIGLAAIALPWLRADPVAGLANTLFVLAVVWASDIGAYAVGRLVGGPKLAPAISPGKTWSGAIGGLVSAALAALAVAACLSSGFSSLHLIGLGVVFGIISQLGDLVESALKRHFGVKDSGRIIPGHGGLLDRLDALLAVAPAAAVLAYTVGRGVVLWR
jgi:phosphatidate cytidylyltransferase